MAKREKKILRHEFCNKCYDFIGREALILLFNSKTVSELFRKKKTFKGKLIVSKRKQKVEFVWGTLGGQIYIE